MGEINKISGPAFDVKIHQMGAERRAPREAAIGDEARREDAEQQAGQSDKQAPQPENPGMSGMLETLRKRQEERNYNEYVENRQNLQRERNRQASAEYLKNIGELREEQATEADGLRKQAQDQNQRYTERLQAMSQQHIEKLLRQKDGESLSEKARQYKEARAEAESAPTASRQTRLRPELSRLLDHQRARGESLAQEQDTTAETGAETESLPPSNRQLLDKAVQKMRTRLGGAHLNPHKGLASEFNPALPSATTPMQTPRPERELFRPDVAQVRHAMAHARELKEQDPNRYIPLEEADLQALLYENKLPVHQGLVQALLLASQRLRDSSHHFMQAAVLLATAKLQPNVETLHNIIDVLRTFERYPRKSLLVKLMRFLISKRQAEMQQAQPRPVSVPHFDDDEVILYQTQAVPNFKGGQGKLAIGLPARPALLPQAPDLSQAPLYRPVARETLKILTPEEIAQAYADAPDTRPEQELISDLLRQYGLPDSKLMARQLLDNARGQPLRAQAMIIRLAQGESLAPEALDTLEQQLQGVSPEVRRLPPAELLSELGLEVSQKLQARLETDTVGQLSAQARTLWREILQGPLSAFRTSLQTPAPAAVAGLLSLWQLAQKTETLNNLIPRLQQSLRQQPEQTLHRLAQLAAPLQTALAQQPLPTARVLRADSRVQLAQSYGQLLQGETEVVQWPACLSQLKWQRPAVLQAELLMPEVVLPLPEAAPSSHQIPTAVPETELFTAFSQALSQRLQKALRQMPLARTALTDLLTLATRTGLSPLLVQRLEKLWSDTVPLQSLQRLEHLGPFLRQGLAQLQVPPDQQLSPDSQQQLLHVLQQQLEKGGQAYLLPRVLIGLRWQGTSAAALPLTPVPVSRTTPTPVVDKSLPQVNTAAAFVEVLRQALPPQSDVQMARLEEPLRLLGTLAEQTAILQRLLPPLLLQAQHQPLLLAQNLESVESALQLGLELYLKTGQTRLPLENQEALVQLLLQRLQLQHPTARPLPAREPEALWSRFYSAEPTAELMAQLADPRCRQSLNDLHRLCQDFDLSPLWQQQMRTLWQHPPAELSRRLATLSDLLAPVLEHLSRYPQQGWLTPAPLQNRVTQAIWQFLSQGVSEPLVSALLAWRTTSPHSRDPLPLVQERLRLWGLVTEPERTERLWHLAHGSRDRLDALAVLTRWHLPLLPENTQQVQSHLQALAPQSRFQSADPLMTLLLPHLTQHLSQSPTVVSPALMAVQSSLQLPLPGLGARLNPLLVQASAADPLVALCEQWSALALEHPVWQQTALSRNACDSLNELGQAFNTLQNTLPMLEEGSTRAGHEALQVCFRALETAFTRCEARLKLLGGLTPREGGWLERLPVRVQEWTQALRTQNLLPEDMMRTLRHFSHHLARIAPGLERCLNLLPPAVATELGGLPTGHDPLPALHAEMSAFLALLDAAHPAPERRAPIQLLKQFLQSLMPFPEQHENIQAALLTLDTVLPPLEGHDSPAENWPSRLPQRLYQLLKLGLSDAELHPILSAAQRLFPRLALLAGQLPLTARATPPELWLPAEFPAEALALPDAPLPDTPEALRVYLKACGLGEPSDARCSQLLRLAQGSRERLEALLLLTRAQMPLLPAHIQTMVEYVRLVPPGERFQSISQVLLYLSDALIARLKTEIQQQPSPATLTQLLKAQDWQPDETARPLCESLLRDTPTEPSPETFESLRYLLQSPLPKTTQNLEKLQLLTQMDWHPRQLLQKIQEPLAHLLALLQTSLWGQQPQALPMQRYLLHLQQYFQQVQQLLSPGQQMAPGPWLLSLSTRLQALETDFLAKLPEYEAALHDDSPPLPGLFRRVIRQVGRQAERLASEQPERREEIQQALARFQQETHHLQEKLSALQGFMAAEQSQESGARQLLLPVWFQALGYPAEISIRERPEGEPGQSGRQQTEIQLKIDTHTLGTLLFSLHLRADGLHLRLGVESARIRQWIQPYLEALAQKLGDLPWTIQTLQVWIMPQAHQGHNLITRQMYARYRRASIDAL